MSETLLYKGDCLEVMKCIKDKSLDMICADLPYGTTRCKWDSIIPFDKLWEQYHRVIKDNGAIVLFGQEPFSSMLRVSNIKDYKYDWYWEKERLTNVFQIKRRPGKIIETISVFYKSQPTYNPQKTIYTGPPRSNKIGPNARFSETQNPNSKIKPMEYFDNGTRKPLQIIKESRN